MADLVVVGSYNASMTVYTGRLPAAGETVIGSRFERGPGGKGANQAIGARRLGTDVLFITRLGADAFGDEARSILLAEGLPGRGITTDDKSPTGMALILVEDSGQNAIAVAPGANLQLSGPGVLDSFGTDLRNCKYLLMQLECRSELAVGRFRQRRSHHSTSSLPMRASFRRLRPRSASPPARLTCWPGSCLSTESATWWSRWGNAEHCGHRRQGSSISMLIRSVLSTRREQATHSTLGWPRPWHAVSQWNRRSISAAGLERSA
jgi:hypothetical protein